MKATLLGGKLTPIVIERRGLRAAKITKNVTVERIDGHTVWISFEKEQPPVWYPVPVSDIASMEIVEP